jgi:hypothetical protein
MYIYAVFDTSYNDKQLREDQMNREGQKAAERDKALNNKIRQQVLLVHQPLSY